MSVCLSWMCDGCNDAFVFSQLWEGVSVPAGDMGGTTRGTVERHNLYDTAGETSSRYIVNNAQSSVQNMDDTALCNRREMFYSLSYNTAPLHIIFYKLNKFMF